MMFHGVLDPEPGKLVFAVYSDGAEIGRAERMMRARDASCLPDFIASELARWNLKLKDVRRWTIGSGPGSFTFLRVVAALAAGWKVGHDDMEFRCVPGALALGAALLPAENETVGVLYDGRNRELLYFGVRRVNGELIPTGETAVLNAEQAVAFFGARPDERRIAFDVDAPAVAALLPPGVALKTGAPDLAALVASSVPFDGDLNHLVYIRPAVEGEDKQ